MEGDAWLILFIKVIWRIIMGAKIIRTPKPQPTMKGNQGIPVPACMAIKVAAVALNTGAPQAHMKGNE